MLGTGNKEDFGLGQPNLIEGTNKFPGVPDPPGAPVADDSLAIDDGEIEADRDVSRTEIESGAGRFHGATPVLEISRVLAEESQMSDIGPGLACPGLDGQKSGPTACRKRIQTRGLSGLQRRLPTQSSNRHVAQTVVDQDEASDPSG
jgi:hypothetical protein